jgi:hypothetical protein
MTRPCASWRAIILPILMGGTTFAGDTCECADIADLRNREAEQRAAIDAYRAAVGRWGGAAPEANETSRRHFQDTDIQTAIDRVTTQGTNKARGVTDPNCRTSLEETSRCMREVAAQHEHPHAAACSAHRDAHPLSMSRWPTLAEYALEEIAAYEAEAAYAHAALVDLTAKCQLQIEMKSQIAGGMETTMSNANARVLATFTAPDHQPTTPYQGSGTLQYRTRDTGPPKKVGDRMLMKLVSVCYAASEGSGDTPFNVIDGHLWRSNTAPYEPRMSLVFEIHDTGETRKLKGERGCLKSSEPRAFWSQWFLVSKTTTTAANHVLIDDWTFEPRPGVFAEKEIRGTCGTPARLPGPLAAYGPLPPCDETTTFTVRLKR